METPQEIQERIDELTFAQRYLQEQLTLVTQDIVLEQINLVKALPSLYEKFTFRTA